jgi:hypothetical protein
MIRKGWRFEYLANLGIDERASLKHGRKLEPLELIGLFDKLNVLTCFVSSMIL